MSATLIGTWPVGSAGWLAARRGALGGSEVAAVMGLSPFESRFSLWHRKQNLIGPIAETPPMEWGNRLEAAVAQKFADEHPEIHVHSSGVWRNDERPWQVATPDRLLVWPEADGVLECKTALYAYEWGESGSDEIPVWYRCQVLWYLDTLGMKIAYLAVLIGGADYREYVIERDEQAESDIAEMRAAAEAFLTSIERGVRPDIDADGHTYEAIRELHPEINGDSIDISDDIAHDLLRSKAQFDNAKRIHQHAKSRLADVMGNAQYAYWNGSRIADRRARAGGTPYVQLANKLPTLELEQAS